MTPFLDNQKSWWINAKSKFRWYIYFRNVSNQIINNFENQFSSFEEKTRLAWTNFEIPVFPVIVYL